MLSVIVPVYNAAPTIASCLVSLLSYKGEELQVIVVDDGSQDGSGRICDSFAQRDSRVKVMHQANAGVSKARNAGLELAEGDWISFVDADDVVLPGYVDACISRDNPADVAFFAHEGYRLTAGLYEGREAFEPLLLSMKRNEQGFEFYGYTWNKFFRASIIREQGLRFPEELSHREDEYFTTEYLRYATSVEVLPEPLYRYNIDNNTEHLTHKKLSAQTLWQLAQAVGRQSSYWTASEELRRYDLYRATYMYCDAMLQAGFVQACRIAPEICSFVGEHLQDIDPQQYPYGFLKRATSPLKLLLWWGKRKLKS